ncbi:hypothetical protein CLOM_g7172 [Closterium sp. NIES-68]|nr:hypothetical protein CLOM_g7172 [Closterium sp. NIES-68]GJP78977.1 hypothetical protein CLOP_g9234 [Closterium sp. NIES-67]
MDNASFAASPAAPPAASSAASSAAIAASLNQPVESALYLWGFNLRGQTSHRAGLRGDPRTWRCQRAPLRIAGEKFRARDGRPVALASVACGLEHSAAVGIDGSLFTWGSNEYGQLGDGTEQSRREPVRVAALAEAGEEVTAVACGAQCTAAITRRRGEGRGRGRGTGKRGGDEVEKGGNGEEDAEEGRLWVWGQNQNSNLPRLMRGAFPPKTVVVQVSCGDSHAAAVSKTGLLQTWGYNEHGQLGIGRACDGLQKPHLVTSFQRFLDDPPLACPDEIRTVAVACGGFHTAAVDDKGEM